MIKPIVLGQLFTKMLILSTKQIQWIAIEWKEKSIIIVKHCKMRTGQVNKLSAKLEKRRINSAQNQVQNGDSNYSIFAIWGNKHIFYEWNCTWILGEHAVWQFVEYANRTDCHIKHAQMRPSAHLNIWINSIHLNGSALHWNVSTVAP